MTEFNQVPDFDRIIKLLENAQPIDMKISPARAFVLLSQLQLALRHPGNTGASAVIAADMAQRLEDRLGAIAPEIAAIIEQGWNSDFDLTRDEFEEMQGGDRNG